MSVVDGARPTCHLRLGKPLEAEAKGGETDAIRMEKRALDTEAVAVVDLPQSDASHRPQMSTQNRLRQRRWR